MKFIYLMFIGILIGTIFCYAYMPKVHFWKDEKQRLDEDCEIRMPEFNISGEYCFNGGWSKYCKISYPEYCPNNEYSDYDRCLRNCISYGTKPCPC